MTGQLKRKRDYTMNILTAASAVTRYAGTLPEMLPRFGVIAVAVAIVIIALLIYNKMKK